MKLQKISLITTAVLGTLWSVTSHGITPGNGWADSYSSDGSCYCASTFDHGIGEYTVDTPAGLKTVIEVCDAIGPGPGKGSNPVYNTVQCGNPPGHDDAITIDGEQVKDEQVCPGRVDLGEAGCNEIGPTWDLSVFGDQQILHNIPGKIEAEESTSQEGTEPEETKDTGGGLNVGHIESGDYLSYTAMVEKSGIYNVELRVATPRENTTIALSLNGSQFETLDVPNTGDWQVWTTIETAVNLTAGEQTLRLDFNGNSNGLLNINWIETSILNTSTIAPTNVSANSNDGNSEQNTIDNDLSTRWSSKGNDGSQWLQYDFSASPNLSAINIAFYKGDQRSAYFQVQSSDTGSDWVVELDESSNANTTALETFTFNETITSPYVRIVGFGNSANVWNSVTEVTFEQSTVITEPEDVLPVDTTAYSSTDDGNVASNTLDGDLGTRWSAKGIGEWLSVDLGNQQMLNNVQLAFYKGNTRFNNFTLEVSTDNKSWITVLDNGTSSGSSLALESFAFELVTARYVRFTGLGNSINTWNSVTEFVVANEIIDGTERETSSNCTGTYDLPTCVANMSNDGGGTITLDSKTYLLSESIVLQDNVNIIGQGSDTVITWDDAVKETINEPFFYAEKVNNIVLKDFKVLCTIEQDSNSSDLRNDHMAVFINGGGDPSSGEEADNNNITMESIEALYCSNGMHIKGANGLTLIDLNLHHNGNTEVDLFHNIYFRRVGDVVMKQTDASSGGFYASPRGHGIRMSHMTNVYYENLSIYGNADHGLHFTDGVYNVRLHNVDVYNNCTNPSGNCNAIKCYGSAAQCDIDYEAPQE